MKFAFKQKLRYLILCSILVMYISSCAENGDQSPTTQPATLAPAISTVRPTAGRTAGPGTPTVQPAINIGTPVLHPGINHIPDEQVFAAYPTRPPTSGPHYGYWAKWGIHSEPIPNEVQVHNLEHGGILIQYKAEDKELLAKIEGFAKKQPRFPGCLLVAPYPNMDYTIAMTAWGVLLPLEGFDETAMQSFIDAYRRIDFITTQDRSVVVINRRGPELADCNQ